MPTPPKPTALKVLEGSFQKHPERRNKKEPQPPAGLPSCPRHLTRLAKAEWRRIVKELDSMNVLTQVERGALEQYCTVYGEWRECLQTLNKEGRFLETARGLVEHPAGRALRQCAAQCHKLLVEFGLTPSSRTRIHVAKETQEADVARFFG